MHQERAEAVEVDRVRLGQNRRVRRPRDKGDHIDDHRVVDGQRHPADEVLPVEASIAGVLQVERRMAHQVRFGVQFLGERQQQHRHGGVEDVVQGEEERIVDGLGGEHAVHLEVELRVWKRTYRKTVNIWIEVTFYIFIILIL